MDARTTPGRNLQRPNPHVVGPDQHKPIIQSAEFAESTARLLRQAPDLGPIWFGGRIAPAFREELMLAVAGANSSASAASPHRQWALAEGLPEPELAVARGATGRLLRRADMGGDPWAQAAAGSDAADVPDDVAASFRRQFSAQEQRPTSNSSPDDDVEEPEQQHGRRGVVADEGHTGARKAAMRETVALLTYGLFTPVILAVLSIKQRRNPISLITAPSRPP